MVKSIWARFMALQLPKYFDPRPAGIKFEKALKLGKEQYRANNFPTAPQDGLHHHENAQGGHMQRGWASGCTFHGTE